MFAGAVFRFSPFLHNVASPLGERYEKNATAADFLALAEEKVGPNRERGRRPKRPPRDDETVRLELAPLFPKILAAGAIFQVDSAPRSLYNKMNMGHRLGVQRAKNEQGPLANVARY